MKTLMTSLFMITHFAFAGLAQADEEKRAQVDMELSEFDQYTNLKITEALQKLCNRSAMIRLTHSTVRSEHVDQNQYDYFYTARLIVLPGKSKLGGPHEIVEITAEEWDSNFEFELSTRGKVCKSYATRDIDMIPDLQKR